MGKDGLGGKLRAFPKPPRYHSTLMFEGFQEAPSWASTMPTHVHESRSRFAIAIPLLKNPPTSQHYCNGRFKEGSQLGTHYAERRQFLGQLYVCDCSSFSREEKIPASRPHRQTRRTIGKIALAFAPYIRYGRTTKIKVSERLAFLNIIEGPNEALPETPRTLQHHRNEGGPQLVPHYTETR